MPAAKSSAARRTRLKPAALFLNLRFNFFAAIRAAFGVTEPFRFKKHLLAFIKDERLVAVDAGQCAVFGIGFGLEAQQTLKE